eukprot:1742061-Pleurochrysis_carterae.AAC.2
MIRVSEVRVQQVRESLVERVASGGERDCAGLCGVLAGGLARGSLLRFLGLVGAFAVPAWTVAVPATRVTLVPCCAGRSFRLHSTRRIRDVARWVRRLSGPCSEGGTGSVEFNLAAHLSSFVFTKYRANRDESSS